MCLESLYNFLADTWWFGLSYRLDDDNFKRLAQLRAAQGFSAIQLVVGIPPEIGPLHKDAASPVGFPLDIKGEPNRAYLSFAYSRIQFLNQLGLKVIIYGSWGHHIKWFGREAIVKWWQEIIQVMDTLDVIYCLTGESDLWIGKEDCIYPDKSTQDLLMNAKLRNYLPDFVSKVLRQLLKVFNKVDPEFEDKRKKDWSWVLRKISTMTKRPIIVHPTIYTGYESVYNPELLAANTVQTGHAYSSKNELWQKPLEILNASRGSRYINLEPWYEGIFDSFYTQDQLFAYWVTMLAGAASYCYGCHGIWNVGDGFFLSQWGKQTFEEAISLNSPRLVGLSHKQFLKYVGSLRHTEVQVEKNRLIAIKRFGTDKAVTFFPAIEKITYKIKAEKIWLPLDGVFTKILPKQGQVVIFE